MANRHNGHATHCDHALAFCERCDVPYCTKCNYEWSKPCALSHYPWYGTTVTYQPNYPTTYPTIWGTVAVGDANDSITVTNAVNTAEGIVRDHAAHTT